MKKGGKSFRCQAIAGKQISTTELSDFQTQKLTRGQQLDHISARAEITAEPPTEP